MKSKSTYQFVLIFIFFQLSCFNTYGQIPLDGLLGYYKVDGDALDHSGNDMHGTIKGAVSFTEDRNGIENGALFLDGGFVELEDTTDFFTTTSVSISVWINPSEISDWQAIVTKWNGFGLGGYYLGINPDGNLIRWNLDMPNPIDGNNVQPNTWLHVTATHDGDTTKLYMDGELVDQQAYNEPISVNNANVIIGSQNNILNEFTFLGAMDDILIYNRALDGDEVLDIFNYMSTSNSTQKDANFEIILYPNPADDYLLIKNNFKSIDNSFVILDVRGKNIMKGNIDQNLVNLSSMSPGIYFVILRIDDRIFTEKLIKR